MKNAILLFLIVLAFAMGVCAGTSKQVFYRVQPVSATEIDIACTHDRPKTAMRLDGLLEVYCFPAPDAHN